MPGFNRRRGFRAKGGADGMVRPNDTPREAPAPKESIIRGVDLADQV